MILELIVTMVMKMMMVVAGLITPKDSHDGRGNGARDVREAVMLVVVVVMVMTEAVTFLPVVLKTVATVISGADPCAGEIRTRVLAVHCSWLLQTGGCEGGVCERKGHMRTGRLCVNWGCSQ